MNDDQQDIDDAGFAQQQQEEQRRREEKPLFMRFFKPQPRISRDLFTTPMQWPVYDRVRKVWV